jgi:hypothetical protein
MTAGVFVTRGLMLTIPAGTDFFSGTITLQAHYDVCPKWLKLSLDHLREAQKCRDKRGHQGSFQ